MSRPAPETAPLSARPVNLPIVQSSWPKFLEHLKTTKSDAVVTSRHGGIIEVKDNTITAVFHNAGGTSKQVVEKSNYMTTIINSLRDYFKTNLKIRFEVDMTKKAVAADKRLRPWKKKSILKRYWRRMRNYGTWLKSLTVRLSERRKLKNELDTGE